MSIETRFIPATCPGCSAPVSAPYSRFARASRHALYGPLLGAVFGLAVALSLGAFWAVAQVTAPLFVGLQRKERGLIYFLAVSAVMTAVVWACVRLARLLERLPRRFEYRCEACEWTGPAEVVVRPGRPGRGPAPAGADPDASAP